LAPTLFASLRSILIGKLLPPPAPPGGAQYPLFNIFISRHTGFLKSLVGSGIKFSASINSLNPYKKKKQTAKNE
jgi:hypothetical protein